MACDRETALFVFSVSAVDAVAQCRGVMLPASSCPPVRAGSSECFDSEQTGCVPVVVAYQGTVVAPQASTRFTYCSRSQLPGENRLR